MRVSTSMLYSSGVKGINDQWAAALKVQQQMTTGRRIVTPSDDPVAAAQALNVQQAKDINTQFATNIKYATTALSFVEGQMGGITDMFGNLKELAIQAMNGSLTPAQRAPIAAELRVRFDGLMALANSKDENGQYLFSGYMGDTQPFTGDVDTAVTYNGDSGERQMQISPSRVMQTGVPGDAVFENIQNSSGVQQSIFTTLSNLIHAVESGNTAAVTTANSDLQLAFDHIMSVRTGMGGKLNELDAVKSINTDLNVQYASTLSDLQDLDVVAAASELAQRQVQLQAAQKSFNMTTGLSLFSYL